MNEKKPIIEIKGFSKSYDKKKNAVDNLNLQVEAGDIYGFLGSNGAGKTTTIKALVGVMDFTEGEMYINGHNVKTQEVACKTITSYVPDNNTVYEFLTGKQYIDYIADLYNVPEADRFDRIKKYGDLFEITNRLGDLISSYSHGMKQKIIILGALIHKPKLLVLDEPFIGLDPQSSFNLKQIMVELCNDGGAIFFSTHILEVAEKLCNKIAIIKDGKLVKHGITEEILGDNSLEEVFLEIAKKSEVPK
jgi:ABC-2 type transport system ATP-binding protein